MKLAMVVTPLRDDLLKLASQVGVEEIVVRYPGIEAGALQMICQQVEGHGMKVGVVEGYLPMKQIVAGRDGRDAELAEMTTLIKQAAQSGVDVVCYNSMVTLDMYRTAYNVEARGGALVNTFDATKYVDGLDPADRLEDDERKWEHVAWFLKRIVPVCEAEGVKLAMHPDDPPMSLPGEARIMRNVEAFERLIDTQPSEVNGVCFCQGCFSEMGVDVPAAIRKLGRRVNYVHFRDVTGCVPCFSEAFHDAGQTDMFAAMQAWKDVGFAGPMRPDHVPRMEGEPGEATGYSMQGRLFAVGYMRGLMHAAGIGRSLHAPSTSPA